MAPLELPKNFILLKETVSITGYNEANNTGLSSNEHSSIMKDDDFNTFDLFSGFGENRKKIMSWKWQDGDKEKFKELGGKYTVNLYFCAEDWEVYKISLSGGKLTPWIEFKNDLKTNPKNIKENYLVIKKINTVNGEIKLQWEVKKYISHLPEFILGDEIDEILCEVATDKLAFVTEFLNRDKKSEVADKVFDDNEIKPEDLPW